MAQKVQKMHCYKIERLQLENEQRHMEMERERFENEKKIQQGQQEIQLATLNMLHNFTKMLMGKKKNKLSKLILSVNKIYFHLKFNSLNPDSFQLSLKQV